MKKFVFWVLISTGTLVAQTPTITAVLNTVEVNAGIQDTRLSPGNLATVFGTNFGSSATGITVTAGGAKGFPISGQVSPNQIVVPGFSGLHQINFQVPTGVREGDAVPLTLSMPGSIIATATLAVHSR